MVILGSGDRGKNYPSLTAMLEDNNVDPVRAARGTELIVYRLTGGRAEILARGVKLSCDGGILVLGLRPDEYEYAGGVPILGTGGTEDAEAGDRRENRVTLQGKKVASGVAYAAWQHRRSGGR